MNSCYICGSGATDSSAPAVYCDTCADDIATTFVLRDYCFLCGSTEEIQVRETLGTFNGRFFAPVSLGCTVCDSCHKKMAQRVEGSANDYKDRAWIVRVSLDRSRSQWAQVAGMASYVLSFSSYRTVPMFFTNYEGEEGTLRVLGWAIKSLLPISDEMYSKLEQELPARNASAEKLLSKVHHIMKHWEVRERLGHEVE